MDFCLLAVFKCLLKNGTDAALPQLHPASTGLQGVSVKGHQRCSFYPVIKLSGTENYDDKLLPLTGANQLTAFDRVDDVVS
jgi:hypothetical protein